MENILNEEINRCRLIITREKDKVEKLADALLEKDTLGIIQIKNILGDKPFLEDDMIKSVIAEVDIAYKLEEDHRKFEEDELKKAEAKENKIDVTLQTA